MNFNKLNYFSLILFFTLFLSFSLSALECPITTVRFTTYGNDLSQTLKSKAWKNNCIVSKLFIEGAGFSIPQTDDELAKMRKAFLPLKWRLVQSPTIFINKNVFGGSAEQVVESAMLMAFILDVEKAQVVALAREISIPLIPPKDHFTLGGQAKIWTILNCVPIMGMSTVYHPVSFGRLSHAAAFAKCAILHAIFRIILPEYEDSQSIPSQVRNVGMGMLVCIPAALVAPNVNILVQLALHGQTALCQLSSLPRMLSLMGSIVDGQDARRVCVDGIKAHISSVRARDYLDEEFRKGGASAYCESLSK